MDEEEFIAQMQAQGKPKAAIFKALDLAHSTGFFKSPSSAVQRGRSERRSTGYMGGHRTLADGDPSPAGLVQENPEKVEMASRIGRRERAMEGKGFWERNFGVTDEEMGTAWEIPPHGDPLSQMIVAAPFGAAAGLLMRGAPLVSTALSGGGRVARTVASGTVGAAEGVGSAAAGGASLRDLPSAAALGAATRTLPGLGATATPRAPRVDVGATQADVDRAALARVGGRPSLKPGAARGGMFDDPAYKSLPEGEFGTLRLAERSEAAKHAALADREVGAGVRLGRAEDEVRDLVGDEPISTAGEIQAMEAIRQRSMGGRSSALPESDSMLSEAQRQLTHAPPPVPRPPAPSSLVDAYGRPTGAPPESLGRTQRPVAENTFDELRAEHRAMNLRRNVDSPMKQPAAKEAAGVLSQAVRNADPRPSRPLGRALDEYAAEQDVLTEANQKLYGHNSAIPPELPAQRNAGTSRIANVGKETSKSPPGALQEARDARRASEIEPAGGAEQDMVEARNVAQRRKFGFLPNLGYGLAPSLVRTIAGNASNLRFRTMAPVETSGWSAAPFVGEMYRRVEDDNRKRATALSQFLGLQGASL